MFTWQPQSGKNKNRIITKCHCYLIYELQKTNVNTDALTLQNME